MCFHLYLPNNENNSLFYFGYSIAASSFILSIHWYLSSDENTELSWCCHGCSDHKDGIITILGSRCHFCFLGPRQIVGWVPLCRWNNHEGLCWLAPYHKKTQPSANPIVDMDSANEMQRCNVVPHWLSPYQDLSLVWIHCSCRRRMRGVHKLVADVLRIRF